jgi:hypothetical protein
MIVVSLVLLLAIGAAVRGQMPVVFSVEKRLAMAAWFRRLGIEGGYTEEACAAVGANCTLARTQVVSVS